MENNKHPQRANEKEAAPVPKEDLQLQEQLENEADLKAALEARKEKGGILLEEIKKRLGMK